MVFRPRDQGFLGAASGAVPDQVTGQSAEADSTTQITVSWNAVTAIPGVTNYTIEWSANGSSGWAEIAESPTASTSIADASLSVYTPYYYRIKANNPMGGGDYSANTSATTDGVVPSQITGLTATDSGLNINLAWNVGSGGTPDSYTYTVQRSTTSGSGFSDLATSVGTNSYTNSSPTRGILYYYQVKAVNDYGSGAYSSEASAIVPSPPDCLLWGGDGDSDMIQYIAIATTGSAADFGDIGSGNRQTCAGLGSNTKAYCVGGYGFPTDIRYVTIATTGNSSDYGDCDTGVNQVAGAANNSYGMILGGYASGSGSGLDHTSRFTTGTSGSASEYSDMTDIYNNGVAAIRNSSIFILGWTALTSGAPTDVMRYGSFTSTADASTYGDATVASRNAGGCSNGTRGFMFGGEGVLDIMDTMTIGTPSDATDFGDLMYSNRYGRGGTNATRAVCMGGGDTAKMEECQYWTIGTTGSCSDFGDLDTATAKAGSSSIAF